MMLFLFYFLLPSILLFSTRRTFSGLLATTFLRGGMIRKEKREEKELGVFLFRCRFFSYDRLWGKEKKKREE